MEQQLALRTDRAQELAAEPRKWISPSIASSLDSRPGLDWSADFARKVIEREGSDPVVLLAEADALLKPVAGKWLADRLKALWQSTTPTSSMTADAWLRETGRALKHYPFHIAHHAIDTAFRGATKGFTPSAGAIVEIATPLLDTLKRQRDRLDAIVNPRERVRRPWEPEERVIAPEDQCDPQAAAEILRKAGLTEMVLR